MTTYTVICRREGDWWAIQVPELGDRATQARRLEQVPDMVRSLVSLIEEIPADQIEVNVQAELPKVAEDAIAARRDLHQAETLAEHTTTDAVTVMLREGYTVRDVGAMLDLSPQRISQIAAASHGRKAKRRKAPVA